MSSTASPGASGADAPAASTVTPSSRTRRIVDAPIRTFHALFALCFLGAYLTSEGESLRLLHVTLGYTLAGLLAFRVVYGLVGPRHARLALLWRKLAGAPQWLPSLRQVVAEPSQAGASFGANPTVVNWRQGQNLLLAVTVLALLVGVVPLTLSGYGTYNDWGDWLEDVHELAGKAFLAVVLGHISLVAVISVLRRKNVAMQMVHGRAEGPGPDPVKHNQAWLAALLLIVVLAYWSWEWQQSPQVLISVQAVIDRVADRESHEDDD